MSDPEEIKINSLRSKIHEVIFESDTRAGKLFDLILMAIIALSIFVVMMESMESVRLRYGKVLRILEWTFTVFFTIEYVLRLYSVLKPWKSVLMNMSPLFS